MKTIKRWHGNIKWLFNHPPTCIKSEGCALECIYCKTLTNGFLNIEGNFTICWDCMKKVFDKVLGEQK